MTRVWLLALVALLLPQASGFQFVLARLVRRMKTLRSGKIEAVRYAAELSPSQIRERSFRDHFDVLYRAAVAASGRAGEEMILMSDARWRDHLTPKGMDNLRKKHKVDFFKASSWLRKQHYKLIQAQLDSPDVPPAEFFDQLSEADEAAPTRLVDMSDEDRQLAKLFDPAHLPKREELVHEFPWLGTNISAEEQESINEKSLKALARVVGKSKPPPLPVMTPLDWVFFTTNAERKLCEVWTLEYLSALAEVLCSDPDSFREDAVVLEIAAGDGRLTHLLRQRVEAVCPDRTAGVTWVASDEEGNLADATNTFTVEEADAQTALQAHQPRIVLCSWMPLSTDLSAAIRDTPSVAMYILIGEADFGVCGEPWATWGLGKPEPGVKNYTEDGWQRENLHHLRPLQISRHDFPAAKYHSQTVLFRKNADAGDEGSAVPEEEQAAEGEAEQDGERGCEDAGK
eukprot:TRINITY_DN16945_c0_g1_i2.p1 TRINITY_DN16945_c0_g1~~TRINITY_DN16945_c0_g1_i2.p1  ORF type:complete len:457 (+),score=151.32 TRINITY_DN16945_c0_g1_i2:83-1453(+)